MSPQKTFKVKWTISLKIKELVIQVQFSRLVVSDSLRPHGLQHPRHPCPITNSWSLLKLMSIETVMPSSYLILCRPLFLLPPVPPSIRVFSNESTLLPYTVKISLLCLKVKNSNCLEYRESGLPQIKCLIRKLG